MRFRKLQQLRKFLGKLNARDYSSFFYRSNIQLDHLDIEIIFRSDEEERSSSACLEIGSLLLDNLRKMIPYKNYFIRATDDGLFIRFFYRENLFYKIYRRRQLKKIRS